MVQFSVAKYSLFNTKSKKWQFLSCAITLHLDQAVLTIHAVQDGKQRAIACHDLSTLQYKLLDSWTVGFKAPLSKFRVRFSTSEQALQVASAISQTTASGGESGSPLDLSNSHSQSLSQRINDVPASSQSPVTVSSATPTPTLTPELALSGSIQTQFVDLDDPNFFQHLLRASKSLAIPRYMSELSDMPGLRNQPS